MMRPLKPARARLRASTPPTVSGVGLAPITATDAGLNRPSKLRMDMAELLAPAVANPAARAFVPI